MSKFRVLLEGNKDIVIDCDGNGSLSAHAHIGSSGSLTLFEWISHTRDGAPLFRPIHGRAQAIFGPGKWIMVQEINPESE